MILKMMKKLLIANIMIFLVLSMPTLANGNNPEESESKEKKINWITVEEAQKLGKESPKKVFVDVYTSWCGYCKRMDAVTFSDPSVIDYVNNNFYAIKLDAESKKMVTFNGTVLSEAELARAFKVTGYPTIVFIDETFKYIQPVPGFRQPKDFKDILMKFNGEVER
jgi:thioredoxin-related protein